MTGLPLRGFAWAASDDAFVRDLPSHRSDLLDETPRLITPWGEPTEWSVSFDSAMIDVTTYGDDTRQFATGVRRGTMRAVIHLDGAPDMDRLFDAHEVRFEHELRSYTARFVVRDGRISSPVEGLNVLEVSGSLSSLEVCEPPTARVREPVPATGVRSMRIGAGQWED